MSRVRFATTRALYETFPEVSEKIGIPPTDQFPIEFLKDLTSKGKLDEAVAFCAYLLPRREAVWWACRCARASLDEIPQDRSACLLAAEAWVYHPDDEHKKTALELGTKSDSNDPLTWLALAAGWSSGLLIALPNLSVPVPAYMTARAARIAVLLSGAKTGKHQRTACLQACVAEGIKLAQTGL
jgi:hypothetical protein